MKGWKRNNLLALLIISAGLVSCAEFDLVQKSPSQMPRSSAANIRPTVSRAEPEDPCKDPIYKFPVPIPKDSIYRFATTDIRSKTFEITLPNRIEKYLLPLDILFLLDITKSMEPELNLMKSQALSLIRQIRSQSKNAKFGMATFEDVEINLLGEAFESGDIAPFAPIGTADSDLVTKIQSIELRDGGDLEENWLEALYHAALDPKVGWRPHSQRLIVLITDAPTHHFGSLSQPDGYGKEVIKSLLSSQIQVIGIASLNKLPPTTELLDSDGKPIVSEAILKEIDEHRNSYAKAIAELTAIASETRAYSAFDIAESKIMKDGPMAFELEKDNPQILGKAIVAGVKHVINVHQYDIRIEHVAPKILNAGSKPLPLNKVQLIAESASDSKGRHTKLEIDKPGERAHIVSSAENLKITFRIVQGLETCRDIQLAVRIRITDKTKDALIYTPGSNYYNFGSDFPKEQSPIAQISTKESILFESVIGIEIGKTDPTEQKDTKVPSSRPASQPAPFSEDFRL